MPGFIFKDKDGHEVGRGEGENPTQAAKSAGIGEYALAVDDISERTGKATIVEVGTEKGGKPELPPKKYPSIEEQTRIATKQILDRNTRKPRADKGVPRKDKPAGKPEPKKPAPSVSRGKRRKTYHLISGTFAVEAFDSKENLDEGLTLHGAEGNPVKVIEGGKLKSVECQKRFALK